MVRPGRDWLCGRIEVDETCVGGSKGGGKRGRGSEGKEIVVIAGEAHSPKGVRTGADAPDTLMCPAPAWGLSLVTLPKRVL